VVAHNTDRINELAVPLDLLLTRPVFGLAERISPNMSCDMVKMGLQDLRFVLSSSGHIAAPGMAAIEPAPGSYVREH